MGWSEVVGDVLVSSDDDEPFGLTFSSFAAVFSDFSLASGANSVLAPGVLGVFVAEPKDAKAPDPRPNAEDAPTVGEATAALADDVRELNGLALLL